MAPRARDSLLSEPTGGPADLPWAPGL